MRLSKNSGVDKGPQPLMCNPALTTSASERMKTQRFSYFAGFAARELMREAKPVKARKSGVQPLFRHSDEGFRRCRKPCDCQKSGSLHFFENISRTACACSAVSRPCRESLASQALLRIRRTCRRIRTKPPGAAAPEAPKYLSTERGLPALPEALVFSCCVFYSS